LSLSFHERNTRSITWTCDNEWFVQRMSVCVRARRAHARINTPKDDVEEMSECNLDPRASMSPPSFSSRLLLSSTCRPFVFLLASLPPRKFQNRLPKEIRVYTHKRIISKRLVYKTRLWNQRRLIGALLARIRQRRFCDRRRCVLAFLANRTSSGWEGRRRESEHGTGKWWEARSIIDSPGTRELTVCLHEPASAGTDGCRFAAAGGRRGSRRGACAARPKQ